MVKKNLNPHYDHTFVYNGLTLEQLKGMCLELTVWDREPMLSNEFLGGVRLSCGKGKTNYAIFFSFVQLRGLYLKRLYVGALSVFKEKKQNCCSERSCMACSYR